MEAEIAREALPGAARACTIVPAKLGESIGDYACLSVAADGLAREEKR
jgi:glucokinase